MNVNVIVWNQGQLLIKHLLRTLSYEISVFHLQGQEYCTVRAPVSPGSSIKLSISFSSSLLAEINPFLTSPIHLCFG